jgi:hypothetical protein
MESEVRRMPTTQKKKVLKPNDREVVAQAQFRTGAGPMIDKRKDPKRLRLRNRLEEQRTVESSEE